jgi:hypothetical protein
MIALVFCNKSELPENVYRDGRDSFRDSWPTWKEVKTALGWLLIGVWAGAIVWAAMEIQ